jgi:dTDP-4-dehydrorhamnose reductase
MKVLVLGASGLIGSTMLRVLADNADWHIVGAIRGKGLGGLAASSLLRGGDLANPDHLSHLFRVARPEVVVNCAGLTKHLREGNEPIPALTMNSLLPHRLVEYCDVTGARLIHISTDCVFSGKMGNYRETDHPDATDVYGKTKALGEAVGANSVTLRTSTIGHEIATSFGLLEWFLQQAQCKGYRRAIFSGLPTVEFARVVRDVVIPNRDLNGLYHVGAAPINKDSLLRLIAKVYGTTTTIVADDEVVIDRSLNSDLFAAATGYRAPDWPALINAMHKSRMKG